nr:hypothetical protein CFP56_09994 [Quercus suber]
MLGAKHNFQIPSDPMDVVTNMTSYNDHENLCRNLDSPVQSPGAVDSERSPQLDQVKARNRCGCACTSSRRDGQQTNGDDGGGDGVAVQDNHVVLPTAFVTEADNILEDSASVCGDEGIEEHSIEVNNHGMVRLLDIHLALARHSRCTCHSSTLESEHYRGSPSASMMVEVTSNSDMRRSILSSLSAQGLLPRSMSTSALVAQVGSGADQAFQLPPPASQHFIGEPIWLGHEPDQCSNMINGGFRYPVELSMTAESACSDFSEFDMW